MGEARGGQGRGADEVSGGGQPGRALFLMTSQRGPAGFLLLTTSFLAEKKNESSKYLAAESKEDSFSCPNPTQRTAHGRTISSLPATHPFPQSTMVSCPSTSTQCKQSRPRGPWTPLIRQPAPSARPIFWAGQRLFACLPAKFPAESKHWLSCYFLCDLALAFPEILKQRRISSILSLFLQFFASTEIRHGF